MQFKDVVPWRIRFKVNSYLENRIRPVNPNLYKFLKFGRVNINTSAYWDSVWQNDNLYRENELLYNFIVQNIPKGGKVLDAGCGIGVLARLIRDKCNANVTCLDFSSWACEQLSKQGFTTIVSSLPKIPLPDCSFDVAVATEVIEHLSNPQKTLKEMIRVVKQDGKVICSVPNSRLLPYEELEHQYGFDIENFRTMLKNISSEFEIFTEKVRKNQKEEFIIGIITVKKVTSQ